MLRIIYFSFCNILFCISMNAQCLDVDRNVIHPTCGMEDGMVELTPQNGMPPYQYEWNGGSIQTNGAYTVTNLSIGFHAVTVTDVNGCSAVKSSILTQGDFQIDAFTQVVVCQGGCADMFVAAGGGCAPYTYAWSGPNGYSATGSAPLACDAGTYSVTGTDCNGCQSIISNITVSTTPTTFAIDIVNIENTSCGGGCDGAIDLSINGGSPPYIFTWSNGESTEDISNICAGDYTVTVEDDNGCIKETSITVETEFQINAYGQSTCPGGCGLLFAYPVSGCDPITYQWSGPNGYTATGNAPLGCDPGTYSVTGTDCNGCQSTVSNIIVTSEPSEFEIVIANVQNATCGGGCDGAIDIEVVGGTFPYSFDWSTGFGWQDISGLCAGTYEVTVSDNDGIGCYKTASITIGYTSGNFTVDITDVQAPLCENCEGAIDISVIDGTAPFNFIWSNGATTEDITDLCSGDYLATVTDADGCIVELTIPVENDSQNPFSVSLFDFEVCEGDCIVAEPEIEGTANGLTFAWYDGSGQLIDNVQNITLCTPGVYTVEVMNADGCIESATMNLVVTPALIVSIFLLEPETSAGSCDGSIYLDVQGGQPPYFFQWSPTGEIDQDLIAVCAGDYTVFVTDIIGCVAQLEITLDAGGLEVSTFSIDTNCPGECTGEAEVFVDFGGTPPFEYFWADGEIGAIRTDLCVGNYDVTVTDALGANGTATATISNTTDLIFETITTNASCDAGGSLVFNVLDGSGVYDYFVNGFQVGVNTATDLAPGDLTASVTDLITGCTVEQIVTIDGPFDVIIEATTASCDMADGTATVSVPGGTSTYSYEWSNGDNNMTASGLAIGGYSVTVTDDANGCASHENIIIEEAAGCFVTISGYVIVDNDQDCIPSVDADSIPNILISLDETEYTYTDENGYFEFQTEPGTHTLYYLTESALYEPLCIVPIDVTIPNFGNISEGNNFFVYENDITDLKLHISKTPIRPGFNHYVTSNVFNYGNQIINGTYTLVHSVNQTFIVSQPPATNYDATTRTITWDYNNLDPLENFVFLSQFNTPSTTSLGTEIAVTGTVDPLIGDFDVDNNTATCVSEVVGSYDPNDKLVMHDGEVWFFDPEIVWYGSTDQITYRIRFQNTGTDTAFTVVIEDELDELIDIRNITPGPSSHSYNLDVRDDNTLVFTFDNILLPDSTTNEPASHGYVFFDVDVTDIGLGEDVLNDAAIFFDYNTPIITNEVRTIFDAWFAVENLAALNNIQLSPNPAQHFTSLFYELNEDVIVEIDLLDITGKLVQKILGSQRKPVGHHNIQINTYSLENGTYLLRMNIDNQLITRKLVIIK